MVTHIFQQISHYRGIVRKFERKHGMTHSQFEDYLQAQANTEPFNQKRFILEEEDALDWKIAAEMLDSWLGLKTHDKME